MENADKSAPTSLMPYDDLRKGRYSIANQLYFITTVLNNRNEKIFSDFYCARLLINHLRKLHEEDYVSSLAWVIMPDHVHWLFQLGDKKDLGEVMRLFKAGATNKINKQQNRQGALWQRCYYDHALRKDEDIKKIARYIVANPLRAKLVDNIANYPHWDAIWL